MNKNQIPTYDFRAFLTESLARRVLQNKSYSLRAFAKSLKIDPSALLKIMNGKRPLGDKLIQRLGSALKLSSQDIELYIEAKKQRKVLGTARTDLRASTFKILSVEELKLVSNWYDYAILEMLDIPGFQMDMGWISRYLNCEIKNIMQSVENLSSIGLIRQEKDGKWIKLVGQTTSKPSADESKIVRERLMRSIMKNAVEALDNVSTEKRSHTAMTFAASSKLLPQAVEKIRAFRIELEAFLNQGVERDQVFQLAVALYPVTHLPPYDGRADSKNA